MRITSAKFVKSALKAADLPKDRRPEIAVVGRSNVGKSTLLNALMNVKGLAKTSNTPGKTRTLNFFDVNDAFYIVDLPGYGFAKASKTLKAAWTRDLYEYLETRETLRMVLLLLDARRAPSEKDAHMIQLLEEAERPTLVVVTKIDKLKRGQRQQAIDTIRRTLKLDEEAMVIPCSGVTGEGVHEVGKSIEDFV